MPFYRVNGCKVHMRGTKLPAPCVGTIEQDGKPLQCCGISGYLCDGEVDGRTCDAPLCALHAVSAGKNRHLCFRCAEKQPQLF